MRRGRVVHAAGGDRRLYQSLNSRLFQGDDALEAALAFRAMIGASRLYVADLDALEGGPPSLELYKSMSEHKMACWVDAGVRTAIDADPLLERGVECVVAGLETLRGPRALGELVARVGPSRVVFSLDHRDGASIVAEGSDWADRSPLAIARAAFDAGVRRVILLDLARVGTSRGVGKIDLPAATRRACPGIEWIVGGGVRGVEDLDELARAGVAAALVGSALHDGRISLDDINAHR